MWHATNAGWGWWLLMSIGMVAFWGLVIYGVVWLVRGGGRSSGGDGPEPPATVLRRRLAAGEIDVEEYERLRETIGEDGGAGSPRAPAAISSDGP